ncbi:HSP20-like chaperones superfamily protein [Euphorbia peplus]|nr:HSP20-like chaperones superfamily protein [Euphorbia peplus]
MDSRQKERSFEDFDPTIEWERDASVDILKVYLPGFRKEQLKVQVTTTRLLRISGERELGDNKGIKFRKEIPISSNYDTNDITAKFERGILFIKHPKSIIPDRKPPPPLEKTTALPPKDAPKPPKPPQKSPPPSPQEKPKPLPPSPKIESHKPETPKTEAPKPEPPKNEPDAAKTRDESKGNAVPEKVEEKKDSEVKEKDKKNDEVATGITNAKLGAGEKAAAGIVTGVRGLNYREVLSGVMNELKNPRKLMESVMTVLLIVIIWLHDMIMRPIRYFRNSGN